MDKTYPVEIENADADTCEDAARDAKESERLNPEDVLALQSDQNECHGDSQENEIEEDPSFKTGDAADESDADDNNKDLPIDGGWAWIILLASAMVYFVLIGHMKCFGIIFVQQQERFHSTSSETSIIFTLQNVAYSITASQSSTKRANCPRKYGLLVKEVKGSKQSELLDHFRQARNSLGYNQKKSFFNCSPETVLALFVMTVGSPMSARTSVIIGSILSASSHFIVGFLTDIRPAYIFLGVVIGAANAFISPQCATIISVYFDKRRGFANNIFNAGIAVGGLTLAPIITQLFETYAFTGTYMFMAGFHLNICVLGCLLRPMSFYKKQLKRLQKPTEEEKTLLNGGQNGSVAFTKNGGGGPYNSKEDISPSRDTQTFLLQRSISQSEHYTEDKNSLVYVPEKQDIPDKSTSHLYSRSVSHTGGQDIGDPSPLRQRHVYQDDKHVSLMKSSKSSIIDSLLNSKRGRYSSTDIVNSSLYDLTLSQDIHKVETESNRTDSLNSRASREAQQKIYFSTIRSSIVRIGSRLLDVKLLSKPLFLYYIFCNTFLCAGNSLAVAYLPQHAFEMGVSKRMIALMVSSMSIIDFVSRFVFGYLSDKDWCHRSTLIAIAVSAMGVTAQFMHFMTTFGTIMVYAAVCGFLQGVYFALFVVVILDILSPAEFKGALGFISLFQGTATGLALPLAGYLRDYSGSYVFTHNFIGALLLVGGILVYFLPNVHEWSKRREARKNASALSA